MSPVRRHDLTQAAHSDRVGLVGRLQRQARVDPAIDLAGVGQRWRTVDGSAASIRRSRRPRGRPAAGAGPRSKAGGPLAGALEQLQKLHRSDRERERLAEVEVAGVGDRRRAVPRFRHDARARRRAPARCRAEDRWPRAARWQATRPVPQPSSSTGPSAAAGELLPEGQVGGVGPALDVVPDDRASAVVIARTPLPGPRSASSLRSSSRAV